MWKLLYPTANLTTLSGLSDIKRSIHGMRQRLEEDQESTADSGFLGSAAAGSDHGYALKRYLLETETVLGDMPSSPTAASEPELPSSDQGGQPSILPWGLGPDSDDELRVDNDEVATVPHVRTIGDGKRGYLPAKHTGTAPNRFTGLKKPLTSEPNVITVGEANGIGAPAPTQALSPILEEQEPAPWDQQESSVQPRQKGPNYGLAPTHRLYSPTGLLPPLIPMPRSPVEVAARITPTARDTQVPNERDQPEHIKAWRPYFLGAPPTPFLTRFARAETVDATRWTARELEYMG